MSDEEFAELLKKTNIISWELLKLVLLVLKLNLHFACVCVFRTAVTQVAV